MMQDYDDGLPKRQFDNFQFVDYNAVLTNARKSYQNQEVAFTIAALMEIPQQYAAIKKLGLLGKSYEELKQRVY
jgi:E3 ubiquitin-protein ligase RGLG